MCDHNTLLSLSAATIYQFLFTVYMCADADLKWCDSLRKQPTLKSPHEALETF
eukprot:m.684204 g.684204  ORF g.684204 m.684204 type:complete len:53 (-) comp22833_c2_seq2:1134-1292(-)